MECLSLTIILFLNFLLLDVEHKYIYFIIIIIIIANHCTIDCIPVQSAILSLAYQRNNELSFSTSYIYRHFFVFCFTCIPLSSSAKLTRVNRAQDGDYSLAEARIQERLNWRELRIKFYYYKKS
jgi:hypothetical protein